LGKKIRNPKTTCDYIEEKKKNPRPIIRLGGITIRAEVYFRYRFIGISLFLFP